MGFVLDNEKARPLFGTKQNFPALRHRPVLNRFDKLAQYEAFPHFWAFDVSLVQRIKGLLLSAIFLNFLCQRLHCWTIEAAVLNNLATIGKVFERSLMLLSPYRYRNNAFGCLPTDRFFEHSDRVIFQMLLGKTQQSLCCFCLFHSQWNRT